MSRFILDRSHDYCDAFPRNIQGEFLDNAAVIKHLKVMRPDLKQKEVKRLCLKYVMCIFADDSDENANDLEEFKPGISKLPLRPLEQKRNL
jgi:hypothetical protein